MAAARKGPLCYGSIPQELVVNFLKSWLDEEPVSLVKKQWDPGGGVCGLGDPTTEEMELEEEELIIDGIVTGRDAKRYGKDDDERSENVRRLVDPRKPTKQEVEDHELFHVPYRNWCPICVRAKGKE